MLQAFPSPLDLGQVPLRQSATAIVTLTNPGVDALPLQGVAISGPDAAQFTAVFPLADGGSSATRSLPPQGSIPLWVTFSPTAVGAASATLALKACQRCAPIAVPLSGEGIDGVLAFVPATLDFGALARNHRRTLPLRLSNGGNLAVAIPGFALGDGGLIGSAGGNGAADGGGPFALVFDLDAGPGFPLLLRPGASFDFAVRYSPGARAALGDPIGQPEAVPLTAQVVGGFNQGLAQAILSGTPARDCQLGIPPALAFGTAVPPLFDPVVPLPLTNAGGDDCQVTSLALLPGSDPAFGFVGGAPNTVTVPADGGAAIALIFAPGDAGPPKLRYGTLSLSVVDPPQTGRTVPLEARVSSTQFAEGSVWPKFAHDNGNTSLSQVDTSKTGPTLRWRTYLTGPSPWELNTQADIHTNIVGPALGADGTLYQVGYDGALYALDPDAGALLWIGGAGASQPATGDLESNGPAVRADGVIFVLNNTYFPLDFNGQQAEQWFGYAPDGGTLWAVPTSAAAISTCPYLLPDGVALFGGWNRLGTLIQAEVLAYQGSEPVEAVCSACSDPSLLSVLGVAFDDGTSFWAGQTDAGAPTLIEVLRDGGTGWTARPAPVCGHLTPLGNPQLPMASGNSLIFGTLPTCGSTNLAVDSYSSTDGTLQWEYCDPAVSHIAGSQIRPDEVEAEAFEGAVGLAPGGGVVVRTKYPADIAVCGCDPSCDGVPIQAGLALIDPPGKLRWKTQIWDAGWLGDRVAVGAEGTIYAVSDFAQLIAISGADGGVLWTYGVGAGSPGITSPVIGADGTIYFMDGQGFMNAVR